jgi:hypothetical protein
MKTLITIALIICCRFGSIAQLNINSVSSGNWNNAATWSSLSIPTASDNVTITAGMSVTTNSNSCCNNLTINSNATLAGDSGIVLNVKGNWINSGNYNSQKGIVRFNGTNLQAIGGSSATAFYNLEITNTSGVVLNANASLKSFLTINQGTFTTTGFQFKLLSDTAGTASIKPLSAGADIVGNVSMQRYLSSNATGWRFLGSPVRTTLQDWNNSFVTSGFPGSTYPNFYFCSIYSYDETVPGTSDNGYVMPANITDSIGVGVGYWCWIGPTPTVIEVTGPPVKFGHNFNVSLTPSAGKDEDGWNMVANPYPSAIDWDSPSWTKTGIQNAVYIWDPSLQQYSSYINGIGVNGGSNIIPSSQGFWIHADQNGPVLSCTEEIKTSTDKTFLRSTPKIPVRLRLTGNNYSDETVISFSPNSSINVNSNEDAIKLFTDNPLVPSISSIADSVELAINSLPANSGVAVPIKVKVGASGIYTITKDQNLSLPLNVCIYLEDLVTGDYTDLRTLNSYSFYINSNTTSPRFLLHMGSPIIKDAVEPTCSYKHNGKAIVKVSSDLSWNCTWKDGIGNILTVHHTKLNSDTLKNLAPGIYHVNISGLKGCSGVEDSVVVIQKTAIRVNTSSSNNFCVNQNNGVLNAAIVTGGSGPFKYKWSNNDTAAVLQNLSSGVYSLILTDSKGCQDSSIHIVKTLSTLKVDFKIADDTTSLFVNESITFNNQTTGGSVSNWNFGDGVSAIINPTHAYSVPGTYTIQLISNDGYCVSSAQKIITVKTKEHAITGQINQVAVFNSEDEAVIKFNLAQPGESIVSVYSIEGKMINSQTFSSYTNTEKVPLGASHGVYIVQVETNGEIFKNKVIK